MITTNSNTIKATKVKKSKRVFAALAATVMLASALFVVMPQAAEAANGSCQTTELCLYQHNNWTGGMYDEAGWHTNYGMINFFGCAGACNVDNQVSSINNRGAQCSAKIWRNVNYGGISSTFSKGTSANLVFYNVGEDAASSHSWTNC